MSPGIFTTAGFLIDIGVVKSVFTRYAQDTMFSRYGVVIFVVCVVAGFWYQQRFMRISSEQFQAQISADRSSAQLMVVSDFVARNFENGIVKSTVRARQAQLLNSGVILLEGDVRYQDFDEEGKTLSTLTSSRAEAKMALADGARNFFDNKRQLETVKFPGAVQIDLQGDIVQARAVQLNMSSKLATTTEPITVRGPGRTLNAKGMSYNIDTLEFVLGGPISGIYSPSAKEN